MHIFIVGISIILLASGCSSIQQIEIPSSETKGEWISEFGIIEPDRMFVRHDEPKYIIKEEPYSIESKKRDPELLGPQSTYDTNTVETNKKPVKKKRNADKMTKESCISLIGENRYNKYVKKYGGEGGALRRCLILKRLR